MKRFDAVVTLGGGINASGELTHSSKNRISVASSLYFQGLTDKIIIGGKWWHRLDYMPAQTEASAMARLAMQNGVSFSDILVEEISTDTISNAYFIKTEILEPMNWKNIALVTCYTHQARTNLLFNHMLGPDYTVTDYPTLAVSDPNIHTTEANKISELRRCLADISPGDDQAIAARYEHIGRAAASHILDQKVI